MKIGHLVRTLGSGTALYIVMAACGSSDRAVDAISGDGGGLDEQGGAQAWHVAEHAYPGKTVEQLAMVHVLGDLPASQPALTGYTHQQNGSYAGVFVKAGGVAVLCSTVATTQTITFVLPL
jgi:hypothetical protein